jgi:RNA polymerase sigma factor for flagellar operon FliA
VNQAAAAPWSDDVRRADVTRREFLEAHVDLVRQEARRLAARLPAHVEIEDLIHDGVVGLLDAVEKYDITRGTSFRTYAVTRVRGAILDGLRRHDWRPRALRRGRREIDEAVAHASVREGRPATEDEVAGVLGIDVETYRARLAAINAGPLLSLGDLLPECDPPEESLSRLPGAELERTELFEGLVAALRALPERERRVIELYYYEEMNMREVGAVLGVTESRVCQLHAQAAARLRNALKARLHATDDARPRREDR